MAGAGAEDGKGKQDRRHPDGMDNNHVFLIEACQLSEHGHIYLHLQ